MLLKRLLHEKCAHKMLMKLTQGSAIANASASANSANYFFVNFFVETYFLF